MNCPRVFGAGHLNVLLIKRNIVMKKNVLHLSVLLCMLSAFGILTTNAQTTFGPQEIITTMADGANSVYACDIDGDGDNDVLSTSQDSIIAWYENTDGNGAFGSQQIISKLATVAWSVYACDIDGDGDIDVLSADDEKVIWHDYFLSFCCITFEITGCTAG